MPINYDKKILFMHPPRTGGTSIRSYSTLFPWECSGDVVINGVFFGKDHLTLEEILNNSNITRINAENFNEYFSFMFCRNPWDKLVSAYFWQYEEYFKSFNDFITYVEEMVPIIEKDGIAYEGILKHPDDNVKIKCEHLIPQYKYAIYDDFCVDFIGRFENYEKYFMDILKHNSLSEDVSIPHKFKTKRCEYSKYYSIKNKDIIERVYKKDIYHFGYEFSGKTYDYLTKDEKNNMFKDQENIDVRNHRNMFKLVMSENPNN